MVRILCVAALLCAVAAAAAQPARAQGDAAQGKKVFRKCAVCHDTRPGKTKIGPSLFGVIGRKSGTLPGYRFSSAMQKSNIVWNKDTLDRYLENPRKVVRGTRMAFAGLRSKQERDDVIAYLETLK